MTATNIAALASSEARDSLGEKARRPTDDEILGLASEPAAAPKGRSEATESKDPSNAPVHPDEQRIGEHLEPPELKKVFDSQPELRRAWQDAHAYREAFATPEEARAASGAVADLNRMDALFFSGRQEDHAQLAQMISKLAPKDFVSLAREMAAVASTIPGGKRSLDASNSEAATGNREGDPPESADEREGDDKASSSNAQVAAAQEQFFHSANAATVQSVIDSIENQVERILPEGVSKATKGRLVGEIYREMDNALRSNRQLTQQLRAAFKSGPLDSNHQKAIVSLVTARARQSLPGIAKRVLNEWSSAVLATHQERRARQRATEQRVDIVGSSGAGNDGHRAMTPRDINYSRMSDSDILNL